MTSIVLPNTIQAGNDVDAGPVQANFEALRDGVNGTLDADNLTAATRGYLGLTDASSTRRGKAIIATEETHAPGGYALLATPDRVQNVVLPTDGLIVVAYQALWKTTVNNDGAAAIFIGANQLKIAADASPPVLAGVSINAQGYFYALFSAPTGLAASYTGLFGDSSNVTTGQVIGAGSYTSGPCYIFAAAGTYDVSVRFSSSASTLSVKDRRLWVWTMGF